MNKNKKFAFKAISCLLSALGGICLATGFTTLLR